TINGGAVTALAMSVQPVGAIAGNVLGTQPVVSATDQFGNATSTALTGTQVTASVTGGGVTLLGTATVDIAANGNATFTNLRVDKAGSHTLTFTATSGPGTVQSTSFTITPAAP